LLWLTAGLVGLAEGFTLYIGAMTPDDLLFVVSQHALAAVGGRSTADGFLYGFSNHKLSFITTVRLLWSVYCCSLFSCLVIDPDCYRNMTVEREPKRKTPTEDAVGALDY
jgi:hypothetical protein